MTRQDLGPAIGTEIPTRAGWAEEAVAAHAGAEHLTREEQVLERIARARARKARIRETGSPSPTVPAARPRTR